jgi:hypothetical protein
LIFETLIRRNHDSKPRLLLLREEDHC